MAVLCIFTTTACAVSSWVSVTLNLWETALSTAAFYWTDDKSGLKGLIFRHTYKHFVSQLLFAQHSHEKDNLSI